MSASGTVLRLADRFSWLIAVINQIPWLRRLLNRIAINFLVGQTVARPLPYSLWSERPIGDPPPRPPQTEPTVDYISWESLFNREYTGRHLPPATEEYVNRLPDIREIVALYERKNFIESKNTSSLLSFFAQWFTDSFLRTNPTDRRLNTSNHEIDLCQIYGLDAATARILRSLSGGQLRTSKNGLFPARLYTEAGEVFPDFCNLPYVRNLGDGKTLEDVVLGTLNVPSAERDIRKKTLYATGLERGNSTILYTAISTIFLREHNRLCGVLHENYPEWSDDRLFETARNINIVLILSLVVNEYINQLAQSPFKLRLDRHFAEHQTWYRPNRISIEFDLLYRWHSLTPDTFAIDGRTLQETDFRFNNTVLERYGAEAVIAAASRQKAGRIGLRNNPKFLQEAEKYGQMFARAQRVRSFTEYQRCFSEPPVRSFKELTGDDEVAATLERVYKGNIEDVELVVGLFAQRHDTGAVLPSLMRTMVAVDAFSQILTNPLLSANVYGEAAFSKVGLQILEEDISFADVVARNRDPAFSGPVIASFAC